MGCVEFYQFLERVLLRKRFSDRENTTNLGLQYLKLNQKVLQ